MNKLRHRVVYIPGLGDGADNGRSLALWFWRLFGVRADFVPMLWYDRESYESKLEKVLGAIDHAEAKGYAVTLIGESAGGSMAINAAQARPSIRRLMTIAGANDPGAKVSPVTLKRSPAFDWSMRSMKQSLGSFPASRTHTVRGMADHIVRTRHTVIKGAHNHTVPAVGHMMTIILCLTIFTPYIIWLVKKQD
ncbi:MAG TPA: hypothetical protein VFZ62_03425 [Candidatus Saccharimonadales bacterium]